MSLRRLAPHALAAAAAAAATATVGPVPTAAAPRAVASPTHLLVTATEFRLALSRGSLARGASVVQLSNRGEDGHDLVVRRLDARGRETGAARKVPETQPGATGLTRLTLRPGRYVLFCSLPGHRARGMQARLTVRG